MINLYVPQNDFNISIEEFNYFKTFLQGQVDRRVQGTFRYGLVNANKKYMTRIQHEFAAYKHSGNLEQLLNIAVYCSLEAEAPQNKLFHFDNTVESVTRK